MKYILSKNASIVSEKCTGFEGGHFEFKNQKKWSKRQRRHGFNQANKSFWFKSLNGNKKKIPKRRKFMVLNMV